MPALRFGNHDEWLALSNETGLSATLQRRWSKATPTRKSTFTQVREDAEAIRSGRPIDPIIVVSRAPDGPMVILDGCSRSTAIAQAGADGAATVDVIVGISPSLTAWYWWPPGL
jgi:hypothetical protein